MAIEQYDEAMQPGGDPTLRPRKIITVKRKATIRARPKSEAPLSDAACTPLWLCELLPLVDFDPCSNPRSMVRARWSWSLEKGIDGLKMPWRGVGYKNFPYSDPMPWCIKAIDEMRMGRCTELITLCKLDTSTEWWKVLTQYDPDTIMTGGVLDTVAGKLWGDIPRQHRSHPLAQPPEIWMFKSRLQFDEHPDLIEQRRQERIEARRKRRAEKGKDPTEGEEKVHGDSSNNFCSVLVHHRPTNSPILNLRTVAERWVRG